MQAFEIGSSQYKNYRWIYNMTKYITTHISMRSNKDLSKGYVTALKHISLHFNGKKMRNESVSDSNKLMEYMSILFHKYKYFIFKIHIK